MKATFFSRNRQTLIDKLHGGLVVMTAYGLMQRSNDTSFNFEQESNFWYLCGIEEPEWQLIIDGIRNKSWLVAPDIDAVHQVFEGSLSSEDAMTISGVEGVISRDEATILLRDLAKKHSVVRTLGEHPYKEHFNFTENPVQKKLTATLERTFNAVQDCRKELSQLRAIKQPEEIVAMKKAIRLTTEAFDLVRKKLPELKFEYEIEAEFDYHFKKQGVKHAYYPIVASGSNACTLHYEKNNSHLKKGTLLFVDIGAKYSGYAADITRTFALGEPTARQRAIHGEVQSAHKEIIKLLKPGASVVEYHEKVDVIMKQALDNLGLLGDEAAYRTYFPHAISHGLGIDAHDSLGGPEVFVEGMVLTVEPGIYIPEESIGARIEDDILITAKGHTNLSGSLSTDL
ncbi:MAG: aminopeptidase P family protein [Candidatus Saccharibacteria bacterium]